MAQREINWSFRATEELKTVLEFYTHRNKSNLYALKLLDEIEAYTSLLLQHAELGKLSQNRLSRVLVMGDFLIIYEISPKCIEILSFWDCQQNPNLRIDNI